MKATLYGYLFYVNWFFFKVTAFWIYLHKNYLRCNFFILLQKCHENLLRCVIKYALHNTVYKVQQI